MRDEIKTFLGITSEDPGVLSLSKGTFTLRREYYWRPKKSPEEFFAPTLAKLQEKYNVTNVEYGDKFTSFKGGESVTKNSHFSMKFRVTPTATA